MVSLWRESRDRPHKVETFENGSNFTVRWQGQDIPFRTNVVGQHNVLNITSCIIFLLSEGFSAADVQKAASELEMVKRRQEVRGKYRDMVVIDDFAHHPSRHRSYDGCYSRSL